MSKEAERIYLETRMELLFKAAHPGFKLGYQNTNFKEPEDEIYGTFWILGGKGMVAGGSGGQSVITRNPGIVQVTFWVPNEAGMSLANQAADKVRKIFELHRGRTSTGDVITFKIAEFPASGKINGWQPVIVKIPFYRDEKLDIPAIA